MKTNKYFVFCLCLGLIGILPLCHAGSALNVVKSSRVRCQLTDPDEFKEIFGPPNNQNTRPDGGQNVLEFQYENGQAVFMKPKEEAQTPFVLSWLGIDGKDVDIGCNSKMVLRGEKDLRKN